MEGMGLRCDNEKAWEQGTVLAGISAGSICWFEEGVTDSYGKGLEPLTNGLGLLTGSNCPHYDGETDRRPRYQQFVGAGNIKPGIAADDGVALHYKEKDVWKIVSSRPQAKAYQVDYDGKQVKEIELETTFLGAD